MTVKEFFDRFFFVSHCVGCGEILPYEESKRAFCLSCRAVYNEAKTKNCATCYQEAVACTCMPKQLSESGALCLRKLIFYDKMREHTAPNRLIYRLKHSPNRRLECFVAEELSSLVREELKVLELPNVASDAVLVYLPRTRRAHRDEGFDQSERITRAMSDTLGIPVVAAITRTTHSHVQKALTASERAKNAKISFQCENSESVRGKYVLLVDDIVTTGAGMGACVRLLMKAGAKGVLCFCIASTKK